MTVRTSRHKRARMAGRRPLNAARPTEQRVLPLLVVKEGGQLVAVSRPAEAR